MNELMNVKDLTALGQVLAKSKMFGTDKAEECLVIAGLCQQEGISWMEFMRKYYLIEGKITMRTDAMLADYQRLGGKYKVVQRDTDGAIVYFEYNGCSYDSQCIWEEVKDEDFCNAFNKNTGKRELKSNYKYPRKRMQMLWARAVSDGLRVVCPQAVQGIYTPEEAQDFDNVQVRPVLPRPTLPQPPIESERELPKTLPPIPCEEAVEVVEPMPISDEAIIRCPVEGSMKDKLWDDMSTQQLRGVLKVADKYPELTQDHIDFVKLILQSRGEE